MRDYIKFSYTLSSRRNLVPALVWNKDDSNILMAIWFWTKDHDNLKRTWTMSFEDYKSQYGCPHIDDPKGK